MAGPREAQSCWRILVSAEQTDTRMRALSPPSTLQSLLPNLILPGFSSAECQAPKLLLANSDGFTPSLKTRQITVLLKQVPISDIPTALAAHGAV